MKWFYRLFTLGILAVAIGLPFFIDNKQGEPMLSLPKASDLIPSALSGKGGSAPNSAITLKRERTVYKWKDAQGSWHYGDTPPPDAQDIATITVDVNTNLIQSVPVEKDGAPEATQAPSLNAQKKALPDANEDLLSLDRAMNILNETKDVAGMMEARNQQLNQIVGDSKQ